MGRQKYNNRKTLVGDLLVDLDYWHDHLEPQPSGCIYWRGGRHNQGYGMMGATRASDNKKVMTTCHRFALKLRLQRDLLPGAIALHSCGDMRCCNPEHIYEGYRIDVAQQTMKNLSTENKRYTIEEMQWALTATDEEIETRWADTHSVHGRRHTAKGLRSLFRNYLTRLARDTK